MLLNLDWRNIFVSAVVGAVVAYAITKGLDAIWLESGRRTVGYDLGSFYVPDYTATYIPDYKATYIPDYNSTYKPEQSK